jgi:ATP-grasp domain, R2K clade family 3
MMQKSMVTWLIAPEAFQGKPGENLGHAIRASNQELHEFFYNEDDRAYISPDWDSAYSRLKSGYSPPAIIHGPIKFVNQILLRYRGLNYVTDFKNNLQCSDYMSRYPLYWFLNSDANFTTYGMLMQNNISRPIFIRPNSPYKIFTGLEMNLQNFKDEMSSLKQIQKVEDNEIVLIASPKKILSEFRCIVVDRKVVAYSEYRWDDILDVRCDILPECLDLAWRVAKYPYQLDTAYVVDVCMTEKGPRIVEFNSVCSSGLYACDLDAYVTAMNELSMMEYDEYYAYDK